MELYGQNVKTNKNVNVKELHVAYKTVVRQVNAYHHFGVILSFKIRRTE